MSEHDQRVFGIPEPQDAADHAADRPATPEEAATFLGASPNVPDGLQVSLTEAPVAAPPGTIGIQVQVDQIIDQIHQGWARQMAEEIQRNAELAAALTATNDALTEAQGKLAALTEVTNAPVDNTPGRVRQIPPDEAMHHGLTD